MEDGKIILIGNESDILHCGHSFPLSEDGKRYPSAYHYAHAMILTQLKLDEVHILELLATPSANVSGQARELLEENMPPGHDMNTLAQYLITSRQSYTMLGLRLRSEQDKLFKQALLDTRAALLLVCDRKDPELGIGMSDEEFVAFVRRQRADAERIGFWMHDERSRPREIGQNQLGFFLMWLRYEIREKERAKWMFNQEVMVKGISIGEDDQNIEISVSDLVISLQGILQPLSNYYAMSFEIKGDRFRSVEHYAYQRLLESLRVDYDEIMKIRTTVLPVDVAKVSGKILKSLEVNQKELENKTGRLDRWRQSAMKHKISKNEYLQKLLLSTGHSILIDNIEGGDPQWSISTDEYELQHLLSKKYITPAILIDYMCGRGKIPYTFRHLNGNKSGLLLMELRTKFAIGCTHRIPLVAPLTTNVLRTGVSQHMICFTPESVFHFFYPTPVQLTPDSETLTSPAHAVATLAIKYFGIKKDYQSYIMDTVSGFDCWHRLHKVISEGIMPTIDKIQQWYMEDRQVAIKQALQMAFEQNKALQRVLLETEDALLVSCSRFSTMESELHIGMREKDLRAWLTYVDIDTKNLIDICLRPMAFRPPYFGGNRLGLILMEIRREFILQGVFPKQLPAVQLPIEVILGTDSATENYVPQYEFDCFDENNYYALWSNPFLSMAKQYIDTNPDLWTKATNIKHPPILISVDSELIRQKCDILKELAKKDYAEKMHQLSEESPAVIRAIFRDLLQNVREKAVVDCEFQQQISNKSKESNRMQEIRRAAERTRDRLANPDGVKPLFDTLPQWNTFSQQKQNGNPNRGNAMQHDGNNGTFPPLIHEFGNPTTSNLNTQNSRERFDHRNNDRRGGGGRTFDGGNGSNMPMRRQVYGQRRPRSPSPARRRAGIDDRITPNRGRSPMESGSNSNSRSAQNFTPINDKEKEPPAVAKKPKRVVDESELSEGEILSDED